jgi:hypothetical protein
MIGESGRFGGCPLSVLQNDSILPTRPNFSPHRVNNYFIGVEQSRMIVEGFSLEIAFEWNWFAQGAFTCSRQQRGQASSTVSTITAVRRSTKPFRDSDVRGHSSRE